MAKKSGAMPPFSKSGGAAAPPAPLFLPLLSDHKLKAKINKRWCINFAVKCKITLKKGKEKGSLSVQKENENGERKEQEERVSE